MISFITILLLVHMSISYFLIFKLKKEIEILKRQKEVKLDGREIAVSLGKYLNELSSCINTNVSDIF